MKTARDIMTTAVATLTPEMDIISAATLLVDKKINGAPVVDGAGSTDVIGILTQADLVAQHKAPALPSVFTLLDAVIPLVSREELEDELNKISAATVGQAMSDEPVVVLPDTPLADMASLMVDKRLHTLPVVEDGKLIGIVGQEDLLKALIGLTQA